MSIVKRSRAVAPTCSKKYNRSLGVNLKKTRSRRPVKKTMRASIASERTSNVSKTLELRKPRADESIINLENAKRHLSNCKRRIMEAMDNCLISDEEREIEIAKLKAFKTEWQERILKCEEDVRYWNEDMQWWHKQIKKSHR